MRPETAGRRLPLAIDASPCAGERSGVGRYVADLIGGLGEAGYRPAIVHQGHHGDPGCGAGPEGRYDLLGGRIGAWLRLPGRLRRLGCDAYHSTSTIAVPGPGWSGRVLATVHDCYPLQPGAQVSPRHRRLFRSLLARILDRAEVVICPSRHSADELRALGWPGRIEIIPHGVRVLPATQRPSDAPAQGYVLTVGAIEARKGLHLLAARPPALPWIHLGPIRDDPGQAIARAMRAAGCRLLGFVDERERSTWLAHATVLAVPSATEGFGYPPLEAMASGVPVAAFRNGALPEVLGEAALWCSADDIAAGIDRLAADRAMRAQLAEVGLRRAAGFRIADMCSRHLDVYRSLGIA